LNRKNSPAVAAAKSLVPQLAAREPQHDLAGELAVDNLVALADAGLLRLNVPVAAGGLGAGLAETLDVLSILATGSPSTALMLAMHTSVLSHFLIDPRHVAEDERAFFASQQAWAWNEASAGRVFGVANSENGAGGDVAKTRALLRDGRLSGVKSFCSMGTWPSWFMTAARDEHDHVRYYVVANDASTVTVDRPWDAIGMRSSQSVSLRFDGAAVVGPLAWSGLLDGVNNRHWSTLSFTAIFLGAAEALLDEVRSHQPGVLLAAELVNFHLALQASRAFVAHCAASEPEPADAAYRRLVRDCKVFVAKTLVERATALFMAHGGSAYRFNSRVSRLFRDLLAAPAVRPPLALGFDEIFAELGESAPHDELAAEVHGSQHAYAGSEVR
jgi:alkylation response protein AidB-like acyl-CoA dehydrogenase